MDVVELHKAFQLIESNSRAIAALSTKIQEERQFYLQRIESNSKAIAALAYKLEEEQRKFIQAIEANSRAIGDVTNLLREMQNAQKSLMQSMGDQQHVMKDFQTIIAMILERIERSQSRTKEGLDANCAEINKLRDNFWTMQKEIVSMLEDLQVNRE